MGKVGEAFLFLLPCERGYLAKLEATGVRLQPINLLAALDLLPGAQGQQVCSWSRKQHKPPGHPCIFCGSAYLQSLEQHAL